MVFVTHDEQHEVSGFFANNPHKHTDKYFEINRKMAIEIEYGFRYCYEDGYIIYDGESHQAKGLSRSKTRGEQEYAHLGYVGLPQLILKATENLEEAKKELEKAYQAKVVLRNLKKKYLNF